MNRTTYYKNKYENNKQVLRQKAKNKYRELYEEEKNIKREYGKIICGLIALIGFSDIFKFFDLISIKTSSSCIHFLSASSLISRSINSSSLINKSSNSITFFLLNFSISSILSCTFSLNSISL